MPLDLITPFGEIRQARSVLSRHIRKFFQKNSRCDILLRYLIFRPGMDGFERPILNNQAHRSKFISSHQNRHSDQTADQQEHGQGSHYFSPCRCQIHRRTGSHSVFHKCVSVVGIIIHKRAEIPMGFIAVIILQCGCHFSSHPQDPPFTAEHQPADHNGIHCDLHRIRDHSSQTVMKRKSRQPNQQHTPSGRPGPCTGAHPFFSSVKLQVYITVSADNF